MARTVCGDLFTTIFPSGCRVCGGPLLQAGLTPVCDVCIEQIEPQERILCRCCGEALGNAFDPDLGIEDVRFAGMLPGGLLCTPCRRAAPEFERAVAFGEYRDELRTLIHLLKYEGVVGVREQLGRMLARAIVPLRDETARELTVIAVPLFSARRRHRGYNQTELIADVALRVLRKSAPEWRLTAAHAALARVRATEDQFTLSPSGRRKNLRGAFRVGDQKAIAGREVLLVDDIVTTGATARECALVLKRAGAAKVWVASVARAQVGSGDDFAGDSAVWDAAEPGFKEAGKSMAFGSGVG